MGLEADNTSTEEAQALQCAPRATIRGFVRDSWGFKGTMITLEQRPMKACHFTLEEECKLLQYLRHHQAQFRHDSGKHLKPGINLGCLLALRRRPFNTIAILILDSTHAFLLQQRPQMKILLIPAQNMNPCTLVPPTRGPRGRDRPPSPVTWAGRCAYQPAHHHLQSPQ